MSLRKLSTRSRVAISKAQQAVGNTDPNLANRVTALEMEDQAINTDINSLGIAVEDLIRATTVTGFTQTLKTDEKISQINKYSDSTMVHKLYEITFGWNIDGTPNVITISNLDNNTIETISFIWIDGVANIDRVVV